LSENSNFGRPKSQKFPILTRASRMVDGVLYIKPYIDQSFKDGRWCVSCLSSWSLAPLYVCLVLAYKLNQSDIPSISYQTKENYTLSQPPSHIPCDFILSLHRSFPCVIEVRCSRRFPRTYRKISPYNFRTYMKFICI
jgi:hypothetical protein